MKSPAQRAAIAEHLRDKEKLVNTKTAAPLKPPKIPTIGARSGIMPKGKVASGITPPRFGRRAFYGDSWG